MASRANHNKPEEMQHDLQAFVALWSSLRSKYEGTNITKTIAKLLHMYQPEDGVDAYERLLKTISMLLEDFDASGLRTLVSMVPSPRNASEDTIKDVFFRATGFTRLDAPMFHQNQSLIPGVVNPNDDDAKDGEAVAPTNVKNNFNFNFDERKLNYEKPGNNSKSPQEVYASRHYPKTQNDYVFPQNYQKMNYYLANHTQQGSQVLADPRSMSQGYKMGWIPSSYVMQSGNPPVGNSYTDFIVKTEDNKLLRVPVANYGLLMPCNTPNGQSYYPHQVTPPNRHFYAQEKNEVIESKKKLNPIPENSQIEKISSIPLINDSKKQNEDEKKTLKVENEEVEEKEVSLLDNLTLSKNLETSIDRFLNRMKTSVSPAPKKINNSCLRKSEAAVFHRRGVFPSKETNCTPSETNEWAREMQMRNYDYAAYKRQYYDSVLNFQRAKVQASSSFTPTAFDPSYYEYLQQQQWLYQQHQRLIMGQYAAQRLIQPEYSPTIRNPYSRPAVGDWMMANHCATSRQPQQVAKQT